MLVERGRCRNVHSQRTKNRSEQLYLAAEHQRRGYEKERMQQELPSGPLTMVSDSPQMPATAA